MATGKFIAYHRVSTVRQGISGLGLDAQKKAVADWLNGGSWELIGEYVEVESGAKNNRVELARALAQCKKSGATLIIAKLDRLARNVAFVSRLMESGIEFLAVDFPTASRLTIHILAAVAEHEREAISQRTSAALQAAKRNGKKLGWAIPSRQEEQRAASQKGADRLKEEAVLFAQNVRPIIEGIRASGITTLSGVADALNARGIKTARGGRWHAATVKNLMAVTR